MLAHYQTVHFSAPNVSEDEPRVMVYFRVTRPGARPTVAAGLSRSGLLAELPGLSKL